MKNALRNLLLLLVITATLLCSACAADGGIVGARYKATYVYGDGRDNEVKTYTNGELIENEVPEREGYKFVGWCTDESLTNFYDFTNPIKKNIVLYAKWDIDYKSFFEKINKDAVFATLVINSNVAFGSYNQGSGVVYNSDNTFWYVLTNDHVLSASNTVGTQLTVYDCKGEDYNATVFKRSAKYDLAVLRVNKYAAPNLKSLQLSDRVPGENEMLATVSTPKGQYNTVNLANMAWYHAIDENVTPLEGNEIDFDVFWLAGEADNGSSGGAVLDKDLKIVGIIFATAKSKDTDYQHILAVPGSKVLEYVSDIHN